MKQLNSAGSFTLLCISSLTIMVGTLLAPGLVSISAGLGITDNSVLLITLPSLGAVVFAPLAGKLIDKYGAYKLTLVGLSLYGLIGASVYFLQGSLPVFSNRFLLGGITAVVMASSTVLISLWYQGESRLKMIAKQGMAVELGGVIFLFLGGLLASQFWALPLSIYLLAWLFLVMLLLFVPRHHPAAKKQQHRAEDDSKTLISGLSLKNVYLIANLAMTIFFTSTVLLPITMHELDYNESQIGQLLASISLVAVITAGFMPKVTQCLNHPKILALAFLAFALSYICFTQTSGLLLMLGALLIGIGFGFSIPLLNHMTVELSAPEVRGRNLSYFTMAVFSGQFFTSFVQYLPGGAHNVFLLCSGLSIIISAVLFLKGRNVLA